MSASASVRKYYRLTKPGIIYGNIITATGGFFLASLGDIEPWLLLATLAGIAGVIGSACVFNNYIDRGIDANMTRTKRRALVTHTISAQHALFFGGVLGLAGFSLLAAYTNRLTVTLGVIAFITYLVFYGLAKRRSVHGTLVGAIPGALPPVAGYTAVTDTIDAAAVLLFLVLACWQMAHFYAIAMYRRDEYAKAGLPVMAVKHGLRATKYWILVYITLFIPVTALLTIYEVTGYTYLTVVGAAGLFWLWQGIKGLKTGEDARWARKMFGISLLVLLTFSLMIAVDAWLP